MTAAVFAYELLDSGDELKLERYGEKTLIRPSSLALWGRMQPKDLWEQADARYEPKHGWVFTQGAFEEWPVGIHRELEFLVRLQKNGQTGLFPEHCSYLPRVRDSLAALLTVRGEKPRVLNLFAYTGLASLVCLQTGAAVTHVDISKSALSWTSANLKLNDMPPADLRLIPEDALRFLERELRRGAQYDLVIADPPSFSRISARQTWNLDEEIKGLMHKIAAVLNPEHGVFCVTAHMLSGGAEMIGNLAYEFMGQRQGFALEASQLCVTESRTPRRLPAGQLVYGSYGEFADERNTCE